MGKSKLDDRAMALIKDRENELCDLYRRMNREFIATQTAVWLSGCKNEIDAYISKTLADPILVAALDTSADKKLGLWFCVCGNFHAPTAACPSNGSA